MRSTLPGIIWMIRGRHCDTFTWGNTSYKSGNAADDIRNSLESVVFNKRAHYHTKKITSQYTPTIQHLIIRARSRNDSRRSLAYICDSAGAIQSYVKTIITTRWCYHCGIGYIHTHAMNEHTSTHARMNTHIYTHKWMNTHLHTHESMNTHKINAHIHTYEWRHLYILTITYICYTI